MNLKYPAMYDLLQDKETKHYKLQRFEVDEETAKKQRTYSLFSFSAGEYYDFDAGKYVRLVRKPVNGGQSSIVMSDTPMEKRTNLEYLYKANGSVLQVGLGIGMTLAGVALKPEVTSILVVEKEKEIIDLVYPMLKKVPQVEQKTILLNADIFEYKPLKGTLWDTIYFDIWDTVSGDNWEQMKWLRRRYGRRLNRANPKCWMYCWRSRDCEPERERNGWW